MSARICIILVLIGVLSGCCNRSQFWRYCQKDYWRDYRFEIWGRKNCIGCTGRWVSLDNGRDGYYCTSPKCIMFSQVRCSDTCNGY